MNKMKSASSLLTVAYLLLSLTTTVYADEIKPSPLGGGIGAILSGSEDSQVQHGTIKEKLSQYSEERLSAVALTTSQLVGLYELHSFIVKYDNGAEVRSENFSFVGDFAITFHNTAWQRIKLTGAPVVNAAGTISITGNTMTIVNELVAGNSVLNVTWDGTYLTTVLRYSSTTNPFTETDVWRRVLSPSASTKEQLVIDFGETYGLWHYDHEKSQPWSPLNNANPGSMTAMDFNNDGQDELIVAFPGYGLYIYDQTNSWTPINDVSPEAMIPYRDGIAYDFGSAYGLWLWNYPGIWMQINFVDPDKMISADIDGDGQDELIVSFIGWGLYIYDETSGWKKINTEIPDAMMGVKLMD